MYIFKPFKNTYIIYIIKNSMILLNKDIDTKKISILNKYKYSNEYTFIPIKYDKKDFVIQTPKLYNNYGVNDKFKNKYIDLSFQNIENDDNIKDFLKILDKIDKLIKKTYNTENFIRIYNGIQYIRLKINDKSLFFDNRRNTVDEIYRNTYGNYIICLNGLWINKDKITYQWNLLQAKIDLPLYLDRYSFIDSNKKIPPPPPLPPPSKPKKNNIIIKKNPKPKKTNSSFSPTVEELQNILIKFKKNL